MNAPISQNANKRLVGAVLSLFAVFALHGCFESDPVYPGVSIKASIDAGRDFERPESCGNGICDVPDETRANCCEDCGGGCGDGYCCPESGENACTCFNDCNTFDSFCGDGICCGEASEKFPDGENINNCCHDCGSGCGDGFCCNLQPPKGTYESSCTCEADCGTSVCGDFVCSCDESCSSCPNDCGICFSDCCTVVEKTDSVGCADPDIERCVCAHDPLCCEEDWDSDCVILVEQLGCGTCSICGDGRCDSPKESSATCFEDCQSVCGDGVCNGTEEVCDCPSDCGTAVICGNGSCDCPQDSVRGESSVTCNRDCGSVCGDGACNGGEDVCTCSADCPESLCGDGVCDCAESCSECPTDCDACPGCASPIDVTDYIDGSHYFGNWRHARHSEEGTCSILGEAFREIPELVFELRPYFSGYLEVSVVHPGTKADTILYARNICDLQSSELYDSLRFGRACNNDHMNRRTVFVPESLITFPILDSTPVYIFLESVDQIRGETFEMSIASVPIAEP